MHLFITIFLFVATLAVGFRFGGMAFMDHQSGMMAGDACLVGDCSHSPVGEMGGMDCMAHCLQAASDYSAAPAMNLFHISLLLSIIAAFFISVIQKKDAPKFFRSDQGIARLLLARLLATVVIQN